MYCPHCCSDDFNPLGYRFCEVKQQWGIQHRCNECSDTFTVIYMELNIDPSWLLEMAEKEDCEIVSVGGFFTRMTEEETIAPTQEEVMTELRHLALQKEQHINLIRQMQSNLTLINERMVDLYAFLKKQGQEEN